MNSREKRFLIIGLILGIIVAVVATVASLRVARHTTPEPVMAANADATGAADSVVPHVREGNVGDSASNDSNAPGPFEPSVVELSNDEQKTIGLQLAEVKTRDLNREIVAFGRVEEPESQLSTISARVAGRIDKLFVQFTGQPVRKGEPIATIYSPDLTSTAEEYRLAIENRKRLSAATPQAQQQADELISAGRKRLELWGVNGKQIESFANTSTPNVHVTIYSPTSGTVTERKVTQGQYVNMGDALYTVTDLSTVWVKADVYEQQLPSIRAGQHVTITSDAMPNAAIHGKVELIDPAANPQTRTVPVHIHVTNPNMRLRPGMFVNTKFAAPVADKTLAVPRSAVLDAGTRKLVYIAAADNRFESREVQLGPAAGDFYPVLAGLNAGDKVVTNGSFLIDSQTRLASGMTGLYGGAKDFNGQYDTASKKTEAKYGSAAAPANTGAKLTVAFEPNPPKGAADNMFHVSLVDSEGKAIEGAKVKVTLVMPAMPSMGMPEMRNSFEVSWMHGMYMGNGNVPMAGPWNVTVDATKDGRVIATYHTRFTAK